MKTYDRGTVQARAQEISCNSSKPITVREACRQALHELYGNNPDALLEAAATLAAGAMSGLRQRTYELPEQATLTSDIPGIIGITTPEGDLIIPRAEAAAGQVRQWNREALQHHSTQRLRHKRFAKDLKIAEDEPDETGWPEMRSVIEARK